MKSKMLDAYLVGPFVGELIWEFFRFAPYIIHLKKNRPKTKIIVFTRDSRFDLYGQYADILVPLNIPNDLPEKHSYFTIQGLDSDKYVHISVLNIHFRELYQYQLPILVHRQYIRLYQFEHRPAMLY